MQTKWDKGSNETRIPTLYYFVALIKPHVLYCKSPSSPQFVLKTLSAPKAIAIISRYINTNLTSALRNGTLAGVTAAAQATINNTETLNGEFINQTPFQPLLLRHKLSLEKQKRALNTH